MLAVGMQASEVAKKANVSQVQLSEWKKTPTFMAALNIVRRNSLKDAEIAITALAMEAVQVLRDSLSKKSSMQIRLRAAIYVIDRLEIETVSALESEDGPGIVDMNQLLMSLGV